MNGYAKSVSVAEYVSDEDSKILEPKEELKYLSEALGFQVTYTDFPQKTSATATQTKKPEFITLVKLSTKPPKVSHFWYF